MDNIYYVYEWIRLDTNEPFYVGKGKENRCYKLTRGNNQHFNNIVKSIPCVVNILHDNLDENIANGLEIYYIWLYRDIIGYNLCNIADGGEGNTSSGKNSYWYGKHLSEETKNKLSESRKGIKHSEKTKEKMSESRKGEKHWNYGKHHSDETKNKMSKSIKGRKLTEDWKRKIGESELGKNNGNAKSVICLTTKKIFYTIKEASEYYNCNYVNIIQCCSGKRKSCGKHNGQKLIWRKLVWKHDKKYRVKEED